MIKKIIVSTTVLLIIAMTSVGMSQKSTYTDVTAMPEFMETVYVGQKAESSILNDITRMRESLPEALIIRATPIGKIESMAYQNRQMVQVTEIYQGDGIEVGDRIYITSESWKFMLPGHFFQDKSTVINGDVNFMREDEEYLIFLDCVVRYDTMGEREPIYKLKEASYCVFSYEEHDNVIIDVPKGERNFVLYKDVSENEFFVATEEAKQLIVEFKHEMLAKYPR